MRLFRRLLLALTVSLAAAAPLAAAPAATAPHSGNPILPGYYADPSFLEVSGHFYLYATLDPWGGDTLGCWESTDLRNWSYRTLNWPTKAACTSPTSGGSMVWAPSVVRGPDGRFHMYVSVGSEVWAGIADHPLGPWRNALGDRPLIPGDFKPGFHMIDAEAFIDDDGATYLYWGSGHNWVNGRCWAVRLKPDMVTFDGEVRDVTPANYFEGPFMVKHAGRYFLTYSDGKTITDTYQVRYAVGATPFGPFTEAPNSPILATDKANEVVSPGHHAITTIGGHSYILYHRHSVPFDPEFIARQTCADELSFTAEGLIAPVVPTHTAPAAFRRAAPVNLATAALASSEATAATRAANILDDNFATRWSAADGKTPAWIQLDLGSVRSFTTQELLFEYAWKPYRFLIEQSDDGTHWTTLRDTGAAGVLGSPVLIEYSGRARFLRLTFPADSAPTPSLFEWAVR
ncbi:MAG TPA: family 43 glycosylhydrolase [Opitutaceae bacterium]|nr:family 43 glycosylhydrolase [Opitutaceae bacterium]